MSFDLKLGVVYFGLALLVAFVLVAAWLMRWIINHSFASAGHAFYLRNLGVEPQCADCPFSKRCPYSNGKVCRFSIPPPVSR